MSTTPVYLSPTSHFYLGRMERKPFTTTSLSDFPNRADMGKNLQHIVRRPKSAEIIQAVVQQSENSELLKPKGNMCSPYSTSSTLTGKILEPCTKTCARVARNLEGSETYDTGDINGFIWAQPMRVLELRLHIWGQVAALSFDDSPECCLHMDHPLQTLVKINGVLCDIDRGVVALHSPLSKEQRIPGPNLVEIGNYSKVNKLFQELISLIDTLHAQLPDIWRETNEWALIATLMVDITPALTYKGLREAFQDNIFPVALGLQVSRNLLTMFHLLDEVLNTAPVPMSYENGLLKPDDFSCQGLFDGIGVYLQHSNTNSSPNGFISVDIVAWEIGKTPEETNPPSVMELQKRLQLPKPHEMRVLILAGYLENKSMGRVEVMYHTPEWASQRSPPVSLYRLAAEKQLPTCMRVRVSIARKLACAVLHFHACRWIHGNICDRNIIFFKSRPGINFSEPFFCNFIPASVSETKPVSVSEDRYSGNSGHHLQSQSADIYQLGWVILKLVLSQETVSQLRGLESRSQSLMDSFNELITRSVLPSVVDERAALFLRDAIMGCISGKSALEGNIGQDEEFRHRSGFYWRVVRPLDHCLSLLVKEEDSPVVGPAEFDWSERRTFDLEGYKGGGAKSIVKYPKQKVAKMGSPRKPGIEKMREAETKRTAHEKTSRKDLKQIYPVNVDPSQIKNWQKDMLPRLERILELYLDSTESASIDLLGIGTSRETSRPTIVVTCKNSRQVKAHLLEKFDYDADTFDLKTRKGFVRRSSGRRARCRENARRSAGSFFQNRSNRLYQHKPLSGASIGACLDGKPLPPGTYGGVILIDGQPYGMTVHHLLDPESECEETDGDNNDDDLSVTTSEDEQDTYEDISMGVSLEEGSLIGGPSSAGVDSMPVYWDDSESDEGDDSLADGRGGILDNEGYEFVNQSAHEDIGHTSTGVGETSGDIGDIPGLNRGHGINIVIMQPAQDDLAEQKSLECGKNIREYTLGTILASSGIRRKTIGSEKHEIDWALIQISAQRLVERNIIRGGGKYLPTAGPPDLEPCAIVPMAELSELSVHATGRTSGLQGGVISPAMSSVRLHGRRTFSKSWHVVGNLGIPGDSGSWVVDNAKGRVCGHILARCSTRRVSYIVPMELLLQDIKETLGANSVRLPTVATEVGRLLGEAIAQLGDNIDFHGRHFCPGPNPGAGGSDGIIPLAY